MVINEMTKAESIKFLADKRFGRLACTRDGHPYITPLYFAQHADFLYSFTTKGKKLKWMRRNPHVCVEADEVEAPQDWSSVIVFGEYEELSDKPKHQATRELAYSLLAQRPAWWEPGYAKTVLQGAERALEQVYFRVSISEISGHRATPS